jgi:prolyl oligopeptidase
MRIHMKSLLLALTVFVATPVLAQNDPFTWLEEVESEKALTWVKARNAETLKALEGDAQYAGFLKDMIGIYTATDRIPYGRYRGGYVYNFWQDKKSVRGVWRRTDLKSYQTDTPKWDVLLDLDALAKAEDENWVYKGVDCMAPAYELCMVRLSRGGKDASVFREFDLKSRAFVKGGFALPEAKSSTSWLDENTLFVGTDWGKGSQTKSGYPRVVKIWSRGTPLKDAKTFFEGDVADVGVWPSVWDRPDGQHVVAYRSKTFFTATFWYRMPDGSSVQLPLQESAKLHGFFKKEVIFSLREAWTVSGKTYPIGTVLAAPLKTLLAGQVGTPVVIYTPTKRSSVQSIAMAKDDLYIAVLDTVKGVLLRGELKADRSWTLTSVDLPKNGSLRVVSHNSSEDLIFINYEDFKTPDVLYSYQRGDAKPRAMRSLPKRFNADGVTVVQNMATSKDGTKIPYFLVKPAKAAKDGKMPTLLYGYGGFEISLTPRYMSTFGKLWLERGGAFVIANIRGGGEFGPAWHKAAKKLNRQRAFDDFIGVAEDLLARKITTPKHLGIMGGSNGGLLVGATFTQRPDLFNAVVCQVPLLDMLRYTKLLAGASWAAEYGDPEDPKMREAILKYSPYQNLKKDMTYPKVFFITSTRDDRVHPGHARKMAARMMAYGKPIHYFENIEGGHAASANQNQRAERKALEFVYLWQQLAP